MQLENFSAPLKFIRTTTVIFATALGNVPLFLIGKRAGIQFSGSAALGDFNGALCAASSCCFAFLFNNSEIDAIPRQWQIANKRGKLFIVTLSALCATSAGIGNCYFMIGNVGFKVLALLLPSVAVRSIFSAWLLNLNLTTLRLLRPRNYQHTYNMASMLATTITNLQSNEAFATKLKTDTQMYTTATALIAATESSDKLPVAFEQLQRLVNSENKDIVIPGNFFNICKYLVLGTAGGVAGYFLFKSFAPHAGKCVYGSRLDFHPDSSGDIVCAQKSALGASIGNTLGYFAAIFQSGIIIFQLYELSNMARTGYQNPKPLKKMLFYILAGGAAVFLSSINAYIEYRNTQQDPDTVKIIYVALLMLVLQFVSIALYGQDTAVTLHNTLAKPIWGCLQRGWRRLGGASEQETTALFDSNEAVDTNTTIAAATQLQECCLFRPAKTNKILSASSNTAHFQHPADSAELHA